MTRREYLASLDQYLVTMSASEKAAILRDYEHHFQRGLQAGKTEAQISASLGSPYDVATELLAGRRPAVPTYPAQPRPQSTQPRPQSAQPRPQTTAAPSYNTASFTRQNYAQSGYPEYAGSQPDYVQQTFGQTAYPQQDYTTPSYSQPEYPQQPAYSQPPYQQQTQPRQTYTPPAPSQPAYVDYDRAAAEEPLPEKKKRESKYSMTGIIVVAVLGVLLVPTLGFAIYYLVRGLWELIRAFPGTGIALIAAGGSLSADSLWICLGLICIGISFLALTGLLVMAIIEITKLFIKLFRYVWKECKKMVKEGSF